MNQANKGPSRSEVVSRIHNCLYSPWRLSLAVAALAISAGAVTGVTNSSEISNVSNITAISIAAIGSALVNSSSKKAHESARYEISKYAKKHNTLISPSRRTQLLIVDGDLTEEQIADETAVVQTKINSLKFSLPLTVSGFYGSTAYLESQTLNGTESSIMIGATLLAIGSAALLSNKNKLEVAGMAYENQMYNIENRLPAIIISLQENNSN